MDTNDTAFEIERLTAMARAHYNAARWEEALGVIAQLQMIGHGSHELDDLVRDIKLKQRIEAVQVTTKAPPKRRGNFVIPLVGLSGGLALIVATTLALGPLLTSPNPQPPAADLTRNIASALPTPAPTALPGAEEPPGFGTLTVEGLAGAQAALGVQNVYIILDASGSMLARVGEQRKIDIAKEALTGLVGNVPDNTQVMLRTYGQRRPDDCSDIELLAAQPAPIDRTALIAKIEAIEPVNLSRTPIAASLEATAKDLAALPGETLVVLVSDGEESCDGDPIATAAAIHQARPDVRISVVGFDIAPELREKLAGIAAAGGGLYVDAANVDELQAALVRVATLSFRVLDDAGAEVGTGLLGDSVELPQGAYTVVVGGDSTILEQGVVIRDGQATRVTIGDSTGSLTAEVRRDWQP